MSEPQPEHSIQSMMEQATEISEAVDQLFPGMSFSTSIHAACLIVENLHEQPEWKTQLRIALQPVAEFITSKLQEHENLRQRLITPRSGGKETADRVRTANDSLRRLWDDNFGRIELELQDRIQNRLLPVSLIANRIQNMVEDLSDASLKFDHIGRNIRLQIKPDSRRDVDAVLLRSLQETITEDVSWLNSEQSKLVRKSYNILPNDTGGVGQLTLDPFTASTILEWLKPQLALNLKYSGEIPHRTFFDRLSHGRRPVFAAMMITSLVGAGLGFGRGIPAAIAPVALLLFLGGIVWTFRSFRDERLWLLERELGRLRETMSNECRRHIEELLKEWSLRATRLLRERQKSLQRQFEDWSREYLARNSTDMSVNRESQQEQLRNVDTSIRMLAQLKARTVQLLSALESGQIA